MKRQKQKQGFTLVELLVVIAIIALLMGILMPALAQVRRLAARIMCGANLSGLGKAMLVYIPDNDGDFPRSGGKKSYWGGTGIITDWQAKSTSASTTSEELAFGTDEGADATITSTWFLLIKYADSTPKQFVCNTDSGTDVFELSDSEKTTIDNLADAWDFGGGTDATMGFPKMPGEYCSYSYHMPFNHKNNTTNQESGISRALSNSSSPASPVAADRNPYLDRNAVGVYVNKNGTKIPADDTEPAWVRNSFYDPSNVRNASTHAREGQNVLYVDGHVSFETSPNCGIEGDNIYQRWTSNYDAASAADAPKFKQFGQTTDADKPSLDTLGDDDQGSWGSKDAFLVNEYNEKKASS
ncbi:MAG: type II secretion system protein [Phycisphaerae bacterium]|jgi:prepilin-type N-terminal cleavage/methylation domain-containing protein/prepilin-type processing-associated H-X9-DG protein